MPIVRRSPAANLRANCLRNSDSFSDVEDYLSEYQLIPDVTTLKALTQVAVLVRGNTELPYPLADFTFYSWCQPTIKHDFSSLLPRKAFTKWFYALFFRLALPFEQDIFQHSKVIHSPLNLTILFRLITHLQTLGYPSHWMSELLNNIVENKVTTTARPPRTKPLRPADVRREYRSRHLCTSPFAQEMATLARLFQPLLPFSLNSTAIPSQKEIYKYHFSIPTYENHLPRPSNLMLIFFNNKYCGHPRDSCFEVIMKALKNDSRTLLDPSWGNEVDNTLKGFIFENLREKGLVAWSTCAWDIEKKVASAWMPESLIEGMQRDGKNWMVGIVRTDIWEATMGVPAYLEDAAAKREQWCA
ncbi:hypothetical protein EG329_013461 [Mollisiaceae sp. DMI_Dod_QoI]|nr:hypothetical protein EG329_013461 [Helotiales sp. DMI_Dod_QoI]